MRFSRQYLLLPLFFPWLGSAHNAFDTQPWFAVYSVLCIAVLKSIGTKNSALCLFLSLASILAVQLGLIIDSDAPSVVRGIVCWICAFAVFTVFARSDFSLSGVFKAANIIYLAAAFIQLVAGADTFNWIVEVRTSALRGVTSLAPEPTFFGLVLVFFSCYFYRVDKNRFLVIVNIIALIFVAKSSSALLALFAAAFVSMFFEKLKVALLCVCCVVLIMCLPVFFDLGRISDLYQGATNLEALISRDFSVKVRLADIVSGPLMVWENSLLPIGFSDISKFRVETMSQYFDGIFVYESTANKSNSYLAFFLTTGGLFFLMLGLGGLYYTKDRSLYLTALGIAVFSYPPAAAFIPALVGISMRKVNVPK